jgi:uncharacterized protein
MTSVDEGTTAPRGWKRRILEHSFLLLIIGVAIFVLSILLTIVATRGLPSETAMPSIVWLKGSIAAALSFFGYWIFVRFVERRTVGELSSPRCMKELVSGLAIGAGIFSLVVVIVWLLGGYRVDGWGDFSSISSVVNMAILPAIMEEILFRGLIFRLIERWLGSLTALFFSAALFGFAHYANPNATLFASLAIAIEAGILLGAMYMMTRRLWAPIGLHAAWNFSQGWLYGLPVSGIATTGLVKGVLTGSCDLTGCAFGLEASWPAVIIATLAGLLILRVAVGRGHYVPFTFAALKRGLPLA